MQALVTSGVMYVVARNCSTGALLSCTCDSHLHDNHTGEGQHRTASVYRLHGRSIDTFEVLLRPRINHEGYHYLLSGRWLWGHFFHHHEILTLEIVRQRKISMGVCLLLFLLITVRFGEQFKTAIVLVQRLVSVTLSLSP